METSTLFRQLLKTSNLEKFMKKNAGEMQLQSFSDYIKKLCNEKGEVPEHIIKRANIERCFGHQLFRGSRNPSRDTVIQLAFGFGADIDTAQELLQLAGKNALYPKVKRDAVIIYCLNNHLSMIDTLRVLHDMELPLIGDGEVL